MGEHKTTLTWATQDQPREMCLHSIQHAQTIATLQQRMHTLGGRRGVCSTEAMLDWFGAGNGQCHQQDGLLHGCPLNGDVPTWDTTFDTERRRGSKKNT